MTLDEIQVKVFSILYREWVENETDPQRFVGMQGNHLIVMQKGGEHIGIVFVPANVQVPA